MKKTFVILAVAFILLITASSCKKAASVDGGTWSFKGQTYTVTSGIADITQNSPVLSSNGNPYTIASLATVCQTSNAYGDIVFTFSQYPTHSGTYPVTANQNIDSGSNAVAVNMILSTGSSYAQNNYYPSPAAAASVNATVTVAANGWITISLPALEMINLNNATDSALLTANVKQTQNAL